MRTFIVASLMLVAAVSAQLNLSDPECLSPFPAIALDRTADPAGILAHNDEYRVGENGSVYHQYSFTQFGSVVAGEIDGTYSFASSESSLDFTCDDYVGDAFNGVGTGCSGSYQTADNTIVIAGKSNGVSELAVYTKDGVTYVDAWFTTSTGGSGDITAILVCVPEPTNPNNPQSPGCPEPFDGVGCGEFDAIDGNADGGLYARNSFWFDWEPRTLEQATFVFCEDGLFISAGVSDGAYAVGLQCEDIVQGSDVATGNSCSGVIVDTATNEEIILSGKENANGDEVECINKDGIWQCAGWISWTDAIGGQANGDIVWTPVCLDDSVPA